MPSCSFGLGFLVVWETEISKEMEVWSKSQLDKFKNKRVSLEESPESEPVSEEAVKDEESHVEEASDD